MKITPKRIAIASGVAVVGLFVLYRVGKHIVTEKINPASDNNVIYGDILGGNLGVKIYEWLNSSKIERDNKAGQFNPKVKKRTGATGTW